LIVLVAAGDFSGQLLRKEKDEASPAKLFLGGSSNLPPFLVCEVWRFFIFKNLPASRWSLNQKPFREFYPRNKIERSAK